MAGWILPRFPQRTRGSSRLIRLEASAPWKALSTDVETCVDKLGKSSWGWPFWLELCGWNSVDTRVFWCSRQLTPTTVLWITPLVDEKYERRGSMKSFYSEVARPSSVPMLGAASSALVPTFGACTSSSARIAVYDAAGAAPRVEEIAPAPVAEFIEAIATRVYQLTGEAGGTLPYTVVREVAENLIHAGFAEPVISILDGGCTIRFTDQGPGISQKDRAILPGYTTASGEMKSFIRGVGSGFPIVRDFLSLSGGSLDIEDNLGSGSVVTITSRSASRFAAASEGRFFRTNQPVSTVDEETRRGVAELDVARPRLTTRQTQVLALVLESGSAGPSLVAKELSVGLSTAYRDLALLEEFGLIEADGGKRTVTEHGLRFLDELATH